MKSYDEIANNIFERRDEYIAKQKRKKRIIIGTVTPVLCCCIVLITSFGLWKSGFFSNNIPISDSSQNVSYNSNIVSSVDNNQNSSSNSNSSQNDNSSSKPSKENNSSQNEVVSGNSTPPFFEEDDYYESADNTTSNSTPSNPPVTETDYFIDSIDKINFYSAKKIISDKSLFPIGMNYKNLCIPNIISLSNTYAEYPIDRNRVFTTTMVTYFTVELNDEKGFLAQKLGGTGLVEIVVTQNDIDDLGQMITFKRGEKYYTCFANGGHNDPYSNMASNEFSSHKYIDGFNLVKNKQQENYKFTVHYDGSKVVGFETVPFQSVPTNYAVDDITFIEDFCVVLYTKQTFTIDELEIYFKTEIESEAL